ncbi:3-deoxy-D-manno-octulosonic acid transferase [Desulfogranum mediterraneum]|uniref:3-deoxy-D-manno-octulosonic acid transferase n=1 Tax=Desulfogranum mediterraneum TaxID=160661 RepID=UPI00040584F8|nr:3-deoxy-D-manno-octulosonic acid transferase [Desulfogranum mediterraneum]
MYRLFLSLYNLITILGGLTLSPLIALIVLLTPKYRSRILGRLGWGIPPITPSQAGPTIWVHALSVGETTSALPLIKGLRQEWPGAVLVFSATTRSGQVLAQELLSPHVDLIIPSPLDLLPTVRLFLRRLRPELFILVETDLWPNWLFSLQQHAIPTVLVNGRISAASLNRYLRFRWFFRPLFSSFSLLSMQSRSDLEQIQRLGIPVQRVQALGNLKLDTTILSSAADPGAASRLKQAYAIPEGVLTWICGSTHPGEESMIFRVFHRLKAHHPGLRLILAPRDIQRAGQLSDQARELGFHPDRRTTLEAGRPFELLILDTIGELAQAYQLADAAFIGGSLVDSGGHNPLEAAVFGVPLFFGHHMEDFSEIAAELTACRGAVQVQSAEELYQGIQEILDDRAKGQRQGQAGREWVRKHQGVIRRHLEALEPLLAPSP